LQPALHQNTLFNQTVYEPERTEWCEQNETNDSENF